MKKLVALLLAAVMLLALTACGETSETAAPADTSSTSSSASSSGAKLRFVTGGESGTYYAFGSVIAQHATNNAGVNVVGLVGNGSQANVMELQDGNAELRVLPVRRYGLCVQRHEPLRGDRQGRLLLHCRRALHGAGADRHHRRFHQVRRGPGRQDASPSALPVPACTSTPSTSSAPTA